MNRQEALHWLHQQLTWERRLAELRWLHAMKSERLQDEDERGRLTAAITPVQPVAPTRWSRCGGVPTETADAWLLQRGDGRVAHHQLGGDGGDEAGHDERRPAGRLGDEHDGGERDAIAGAEERGDADDDEQVEVAGVDDAADERARRARRRRRAGRTGRRHHRRRRWPTSRGSAARARPGGPRRSAGLGGPGEDLVAGADDQRLAGDEARRSTNSTATATPAASVVRIGRGPVASGLAGRSSQAKPRAPSGGDDAERARRRRGRGSRGERCRRSGTAARCR